MGFEGTVRHPASLLFARRAAAFGSNRGRLGWLRPGRALAALVLAARSLFRRFLHAVPLRLGPAGRAGWLRPGCALAALVLAAGLWLRGPGESS